MFIPFLPWPRAKVKVHKYTYYLLLWSDFSSCLWVSPLGVLALPLRQKILSHGFFWTLKWKDLHFLLASLLQPTFCLLTLKKFSPLTQPLRHWGLPDYLMVKTGSSAQLPLWICAFHYFYYKYFFNFANTTSDEFLNIYIYGYSVSRFSLNISWNMLPKYMSLGSEHLYLNISKIFKNFTHLFFTQTYSSSYILYLQQA